MKVYELLSFNKELIDKIYSAGIKVDDYKYVDLYAEYVTLKGEGLKIAYIVCKLADKYSISERQVYSVVRRLAEEVVTANSVQLDMG